MRVIICDIDNTLILENSAVNLPVYDLLKNSKHDIIFVTNRPECEREFTEGQLEGLGFAVPLVLMRADNDKRLAWRIKEDMLIDIACEHEIAFALDDLPAVCKMYHEHGINCLRVMFT